MGPNHADAALTLTLPAGTGGAKAHAPAITSSDHATVTQGQPVSVTVTTVGSPAPPLTATGIPRGDGIPNLMKYAFAIDPTQPISPSDQTILPKSSLKNLSGHPHLTLTYLESRIAAGLLYRLQSSADLTIWQPRSPDLTNYLRGRQPPRRSLRETRQRLPAISPPPASCSVTLAALRPAQPVFHQLIGARGGGRTHKTFVGRF